MKFRNIFGLLCVILFLILSSLSTGAVERATNDEIFANPESLVRGLYAAVTFDPGKIPDWDYVKKFFILEAVFGVRKTRTSMEVLDVEEFLEWWESDIKKYKMKERGFEETVQKIKTTTYGNIAHCFVVYRARFKTPKNLPGQRGLDSFSLMKKDGRWWIVSVTNDIITSQNSLPEELK